MKPKELAAVKDTSLKKYNSLRFGLRSAATLLPWESLDEYEALRHELIDHHNPVGPTELHLVEEIGGVIWRKQRVLLAESSLYRKELASQVQSKGDALVRSAVIGKAPSYLQLGNMALAETVGPAEDRASLGAAGKGLERISKVLPKLQEAKDYATAKALLPPDLVDEYEVQWLGEEVETDEGDTYTYKEDTEGLTFFLEDTVVPRLHTQCTQHQYAQDIANQLQGQAFNPEKLELIGRYETHLDRKLERMLAMLLKVQEMRESVKI